jgi:HAD superfamily hydrolase (TIGR01509 family)
MLRALIFDFDGLIMDTEGAILQSWQELYRSHGCELPLDLWLTGVGTAEWDVDLIAELEQQAGCPLDREGLTRERWRREGELVSSLPVLPGVLETLQEARRLGLKVALASSSSCAWLASHLERMGLADHFDVILGGDDVALTKPSPELFLAALESLEVQAGDAVVFEDSLNGILAARSAGIFCVAVPNGVTRHLPLEQADLRVNSLADLPVEKLVEVFATRKE